MPRTHVGNDLMSVSQSKTAHTLKKSYWKNASVWLLKSSGHKLKLRPVVVLNFYDLEEHIHIYNFVILLGFQNVFIKIVKHLIALFLFFGLINR